MAVIAQTGNMLLVFPFRLYNIATDEFETSKRYATRNAIEKLGATQAGPSVEVPIADVDADGLTAIGYDPYKHR